MGRIGVLPALLDADEEYVRARRNMEVYVVIVDPLRKRCDSFVLRQKLKARISKDQLSNETK
jgi:hypothetical protein